MKRRAMVSWLALPAFSGAQADGRVLTRVSTELGDFVIAVDPKVAPVTVANYLAYVDAKDLDGGAVYRIVTPDNQPQSKVKIEVVQWGMNAPDEKPPPRPPIAHETTKQTGLRHLDGTVSMARNGPGTATSEFFICIGPQPELDFGGRRNPDGQGFAAFGQVVDGMATVRRLHARGRPDDQYLKPPVAVIRVRRLP
jgi:peptidyl-prolyl cis-trans isomerase A (cyclophilin A)